MNLIIKGKQFEVTDSIENYIRKNDEIREAF